MFKKILIPVDLQENIIADHAMETALRLAKTYGAKLYVLTVVPGFGLPIVASHFPKDILKKARKDVNRMLKKYVAKTVGGHDVKVNTNITEGRPYREILREAKRLKIDLIVIPSHTRKTMDEIFLGSNAARVAEKARCSVMVVRS